MKPPSHSWFFNWGEQTQTSFPNWFQEWWLFLGVIPNIFCPDIRKSFDYFKVNSESFFPSGNNYSLSFCSQFRIPWILYWEFSTHNFLPSPFPGIWPGNLKLNGGPPSKSPKPKPLIPSRLGLIPKNQNPRNSQKSLLLGLPRCQDLSLSLKPLPKLLFLQSPSWRIDFQKQDKADTKAFMT